MTGLFQRMFKAGQSEAYAVLDKLEDPIKITEQGIRDLKNNHQDAMKNLAEVKSNAVQLKKQGDDEKKKSADYERKAMLLLQKMQDGSLEQVEAERLATEALNKKDEALKNVIRLLKDHSETQKTADELQAKIEKLRQTISGYENELITLKARVCTATSMRKINQQMAKADSSSTIAMLEEMKSKVNEEESLSDAYQDIADTSAGVDDEINKALEDASIKSPDSLAALKKKMGIDN